jgi:hypothetical protein
MAAIRRSKSAGGVMTPTRAQNFDFGFKPPLLLSEQQESYAAMLDAFKAEIRPRNIVEHMYVTDISCVVWEMLRLRRCQTATLNMAYRKAIRSLLEGLVRHADEAIDLTLADEWFESKKARDQVLSLLGRFGLDESSIEAEAFRQSAQTVERLGKMLWDCEIRRDKALGCIAAYRQSFAQQLREASDNMIAAEVEDAPRLQDSSQLVEDQSYG